MSIASTWWLPVVAMGLGPATLLLNMIGRKARAQQVAIVTELRTRHADSPATACPLSQTDATHERAFATLVRRGLVREASAGHFYVSAEGMAHARRLEKWVLLIGFLVLVAVFVLSLAAVNRARHVARAGAVGGRALTRVAADTATRVL